MTDQGQRLSRAEIARVLDGHLCRCTGYAKIIDAVELIQTAKLGGAAPAVVENGGVGQPLKRYQGAELALGERPFVADIDAPGLLYGAVVLSAHARARIVRIDVAKALALPGVVAVATAKDVPGDRWIGQIYADWPVLRRRGRGGALRRRRARRGRRRNPAHRARGGEARSRSNTRPLPAVLDPAEALKPGAPQVNPKHDNLLSTTRYARGDVDAALAASAHVVSGTWTTQRIEHLFLEPEACLARPLPDGRLHIYSQGQGIFDDRRQIAAVLGEPEERLYRRTRRRTAAPSAARRT